MSYNNGITGSGIGKSEVREVAEFDRIRISGVGNVNIRFGAEPSLEITADDDLMEYISTEVEGGELVIYQTESLNAITPLTYDIVVPQLSGLSISGATGFNIEEMDGDEFKLEVSGVATGTASGTIQQLELAVSGAAKVQLAELHTDTVHVNMSGASSADVYATSSFHGSVSGVGSITVHGNPADVERSVTGIGKINLNQ